MATAMVTTLTESVNNPAILKMGTFRISVKKINDSTASKHKITLYMLEAAELDVVGGHITDNTMLADSGTHVDLAVGSNAVYISDDDCDVYISNKYKVRDVQMPSRSTPSEAYAFTIDFSTLKYAVELKNLQGSKFVGNINDIVSTGASLTTAYIAMGDYGRIENFAGIESMNDLSVLNSSLSGDVEVGLVGTFRSVTIGYNSGLYGDVTKINTRHLSATNLTNLESKKTRPSTYYLPSCVDLQLYDDVDNFLQQIAPCVANPVSQTATYTSVKLYGTRTSASDAAVATIKSKGYSVFVNDVEL